jgi:sulfatase modifying factor 1
VHARALLAPLAVGTLVAVARAEIPDRAPIACRAQVAAAVSALGPVLSAPGRRAAGPGSLESAIRAYAPGRLHAVDEGVLPAPRASARCPAGMASVGGRFCIDRWEGYLVERRAGGGEAPFSPYETPLDGHVYVARTAAGVVPQGYVSGAQALAACRAAGKRLCAPVEWRAACGGSQEYAYPYGRVRVAGRCRDTGTAPMLMLYSDKLKTGWGLTELNDTRLNQIADTVAKTGAYPGCVNDFGVYDMVGNLDEWTADPNGTFQGGFWLDTSQHGEGCAYRTIAHGFRYHDYSTGFRCCADPSGP